MRLAVRGAISTAVIALAIVLTGCEQSTSPDRTAATESRTQVVPAARELYRSLFEASARSVDLLDWGFQPCGTANTTLSYSITMRLFAFDADQNLDFEAYRRRVVSIVRADGWTLRRRPSERSVTLPTVPSAYYRLSRRRGTAGLTGTLGLFGDEKPSVGVSGTLTVSGPCVDAGGSARSLQSDSAGVPFSPPSPAPSHS